MRSFSSERLSHSRRQSRRDRRVPRPAVGTGARELDVVTSQADEPAAFAIGIARSPVTRPARSAPAPGHRHDETALLERQQPAGPTTRALGKNEERVSRRSAAAARSSAGSSVRDWPARPARNPGSGHAHTRIGSFLSSALLHARASAGRAARARGTPPADAICCCDCRRKLRSCRETCSAPRTRSLMQERDRPDSAAPKRVVGLAQPPRSAIGAQ